MPEGLSATEVGRETSQHAAHAREGTRAFRHDRVVSIVEAVLLSVVTLTAAWAGYSAAKWSTYSSLELARASTTLAASNHAFQTSLTLRAQDAANFNAWFAAYLTGKKNEERVAEKRFRTQYDVAFRAWLRTRPFTNPHAPKGPQYMPQYRPTGEAASERLAAAASIHHTHAEQAATHSDDYVRITVLLASVLFIIGISSHFPTSAVRLGLIGLAGVLLVLSAAQILALPGPPP